MPRFAYTARDRSGKAVSADLEAPTRKDALRVLSARGLQVSAVNETAEVAAASRGSSKNPRQDAAAAPKPAAAPAARATRSRAAGEAPRRAECLPFLEALHDLSTSGLSAGEAVRLLSVRIKEPRLRTLCAGIWERISEGAPLSRAMAAFPEVFDPSITNLIQAGEATGSLNDTLARIIAHLTAERELRHQLLMALAYPILITVVAFGVVIFFLFFLLPRLQNLLTSLGGKMPMSTRILIGMSEFALNYGLFVIIALVFAAVSFWRWRMSEAGRTATDAWVLKLPLLGPFVIARTVLSFSQTLSVLLENGITAAEALRMTEKQIDNRTHRGAFSAAIGRVLEGEALSAALARTRIFPDLVLDRLAVGENTGNVVPSLKQISAAYQKLIARQLNAFTKVLASGVLILVFVFVGFLAFAIVSAVFQASASFKLNSGR